MPIYSGDRDTRGEEGEEGEEEAVAQNPQNGLATNRLAPLICRVVRAGAGAKTSNSELDFPVGEPSVLLPQPPILLAEKPLCKSGRFCISGSTFWLQSTGSRFGLRIPDVIKVTQR